MVWYNTIWAGSEDTLLYLINDVDYSHAEWKKTNLMAAGVHDNRQVYYSIFWWVSKKCSNEIPSDFDEYYLKVKTAFTAFVEYVSEHC